MIENISNKISCYFQDQLNVDEDDREVIEYGLFVIIGDIFKFITLAILGLIFGVLKYALIICITFGFFRKFSGGVHATTYKACMTISMILFIGSSLVIDLIKDKLNCYNFTVVIGLIVMYSIYMIIRFVPQDTPNRPIINELEKNKFKKITMILFIVYTMLMLISRCFNIGYEVILSSFMGVFIQMILLHPMSYRIVDKFDNILQGGF
ncbi:accessory gene regulator ArgB-like protein [Tepidibacter hydrothermalis]|uniref:Accessory gene regulator B family protein n=1 Tax=Tepidibacter hydrothermalis TaxID=3036126 RepID=A0ABY8E9F0_9FIRM|nr:accessory gene regulator B family protein [Tepidibacter hydrothermalis]WFD09530.1 accessory gene regulator B family protein [Tepidibacter hydrothermalis]